tara:strand:- start:1093 stop:1521 length:429 start_codon:yes stop_codon:yes gene_type:complete
MDNINIIKGGVAVDDRGSVRFVNDFNFKNVKRFYQVSNHRQGFVRAWHGHEHEAKYVYVAKGSIKIGVVKSTDSKFPNISEFILSDKNPNVLFIPEGYYNGFQTLEEDTIVMFFSTSTLDDSLGDDMRKDWDYWNIWKEDQR